jgi:hypothetical protein
MTDEQHAKLAVITLSNTRLVASLASTLSTFVEVAQDLLPNKSLIPLLSALEQLQASLAPVEELAEQAKRDLGV